MRRFIPEICGVECGSREKVVKNLMVLRPKFKGGAPEFFGRHLQIDTISDLLAKFG